MTANSSERTRTEELQELTVQAERKGLASLDGADILRLGQLYRHCAAQLARQRAREGETAAVLALNQLIGRAYQQIYSAPSRSHRNMPFFTMEIPRAVRANIRAFAVAWLVLFAGAVTGGFKLTQDPDSADILVGRGWSQAVQQVAERHRTHEEVLPEDIRNVGGAMIVTNNLQVAILTFALGAFAGVGSLMFLFRTGAMLGAIGVGVAHAGRAASVDFWAFVAAHGVPEITAIVLAGAAGLRLGWAFIAPGDYSRGEAFRQAGNDAIRLVMACFLLLVWAAALEAFVSPNRGIPESFRFAISALEALALVLYFSLGGRRTEGEAQKADGSTANPSA